MNYNKNTYWFEIHDLTINEIRIGIHNSDFTSLL